MWTIVGLMSGTSLDGVDAAVLTTDGESILGFGPRHYRAYSETERAVLRAGLSEARGLQDRRERPGEVAAAERIVTVAHAEAVEALMAAADLKPAVARGRDRGTVAAGDGGGTTVDAVGFHGQTVLHAPERRLTVQIGDAAALAARLGLPVVHDFRADDVAAGGEGAPLVPAYHRALVARAGLRLPVAIVNVGGVANLTRIGADGELAAFDTGPGNALLDDFVRTRTGAAMDADGALAAAGSVDDAILADLLAHPFFTRPPPKSLDRNTFAATQVAALATVDGAATLTAFTARGIAAGLARAGGADQVIVAGGGAHNPTLLRMLAAACGVPVATADSFGWSPDFLEAEAFAFLAARSLAGLPLTFPGTTGVAAPTGGGKLALPPTRSG